MQSQSLSYFEFSFTFMLHAPRRVAPNPANQAFDDWLIGGGISAKPFFGLDGGGEFLLSLSIGFEEEDAGGPVGLAVSGEVMVVWNLQAVFH